MKVTKLDYNDKIKEKREEVYQLYQECFHDTKEYMDYYFSEKTKDNEIVTLELDQEIRSMIHLNPYYVQFNHMREWLYYIVAVGTKEEYRKRGYMRTLLEQSLLDMYENEKPFTYLMPAAYEIYAPYDFRTIYVQSRYKFRPMNPNNSLQVKPFVELLNEQQQNVVDYVNQQLMAQFQVYTIRDLNYYRRLAKEMAAAEGDLICFYDKDSVVAVISYMQEEDTVQVVESILDMKNTTRVMKQLECFVQQKNANSSIELLESHYYDPMYFRERCISQIEQPIMMGRIVHMEAFLSELRSNEPCVIIIGVKDDIIKNNEGNYELIIDETSIRINRTNQEPLICKTIGEWSNYFFGSKDKRESMIDNKELQNLKVFSSVYLNEIV